MVILTIRQLMVVTLVIEDAGWMEIIERCRVRSRVVAQKIYDKDSQGNIYLTKEQIKRLFFYILDAGVDLHKDMKDLRDINLVQLSFCKKEQR